MLATRAGVSPNSVRRAELGKARIATLEAMLAVLAPAIRVRKEERAAWAGGKRDCRYTPPEVLEALHRVIGSIDLDPCADIESPVVAKSRYFEADDGLSQPWFGTVYCNPPYSGSAAFLKRAHDAWSSGECNVVAMLLPSHTHSMIFHNLLVGVADIFFLRRRIRFLSHAGKRDNPPFGSLIAILGADEEMIERMLANFDCFHVSRSVAIGRAIPNLARDENAKRCDFPLMRVG
jgi:hypothetical protein